MASVPFALPSLGPDMDDGTLLQWCVKPGDPVRRGQVVAVVDTSKAAVDVEIWQDGTVQALVVEPGTKIPVGAVMMMLGPADGTAGPAPVAAGPAAAAPVMSTVPAPATAPPVPPAAVPSRQPDARALIEAVRHPVSPAARKRGHELEVDVDRLTGTGPHGSVVVADVERAAAEREAAEREVPPSGQHAQAGRDAPPSAQPAPGDASLVAVPAPAGAPVRMQADRQAAMRAAIAAAMTRAKREIPHYYLSEPIPMQQALDWLRERNASAPIDDRVLPAALLLKAVAVALARVPELNGTMQQGAFRSSAAVHTGVAIALRGGGLVAPAIHDVQCKALAPLMRDLSDLVRRARAGSLRSSEMSDPTITVTQLGDQGVESVQAVIYPPQVAIVGFGRIAERAWAQDGWVRALPAVTATLAADHRVSDGHRGALFLAELRDRLQRPETLDPIPERGHPDGP